MSIGVKNCVDCGRLFWSSGDSDCPACHLGKVREREEKERQERNADSVMEKIKERMIFFKVKRKLKSSPKPRIVLPREKTKREIEKEQDRIERDRLYQQNKKHGYVYLMHSENDFYKIGISKNVKRRAWELNRYIPIVIRAVHYFACHDYRKVERALHEKYSSKRVQYEWFKLDKKDVKWITSITNYQLG
jgi:predicted GIY-YIG superfamily endonuclease